MKILIFIFFFCSDALSQKNDYIIYYNYASEAEYYFHEEIYDSAAYYFEIGFSFATVPHPTHHLKYVKALWKLGYKDKSINELLSNKGITSIDTVWFSGLTLMEYGSINDVLNKNMYEDESTGFYREFTDSLKYLDQMVRKEFDFSDSVKLKRMILQDSSNAVALIQFTRKYGFPAGVNAGWDQPVATLLLHMRREWFIENYQLLVQEVRKGNLEPWMLARGIDRMFAIDYGEEKITPYNRYHEKSVIDPFLMFQNCIAIGVSPYYHLNWRQKPTKTLYFDYYQKNKPYYNTTFMSSCQE